MSDKSVAENAEVPAELNNDDLQAIAARQAAALGETLSGGFGDATDITDEIGEDGELEEEPLVQKVLPFAFASAEGIFLEPSDDGDCVAYYRTGLKAETLAEVRRFVSAPMRIERIEDEDFQRRLTQAYQHSTGEAAQAAEDMGADLDLSRLADEIQDSADLMEGEDDAPVIRLINAILSQAVREKASDIHIETFENDLVVRFRVDGTLNEVLRPKRMLAPLLVSRMKVMAKLDIAEKRIPQDGRISVRIAGHGIDIRMSTNPTAHGERIVLRLLDKQAGALQLEQLRMSEQVYKGFKRVLGSPHGIILVTGPTGSGKTTSLYSGLTYINEPSRNILTIEDPVEYLLPGVGQTQVNSKVDMTFARGLRAILRQDPDVVMIGEIRDIETAEIAVQASLTGHLVLSTLHTNTAIGAVTRLGDMGIEPFLLSSSLVAVMAQRLVRTLCPSCKEPFEALDSQKALMGINNNEKVVLFRAKGCSACNGQGFKGRMGIYEFIEVDDKLRNLIHSGASEQDMLAQARLHWPSIRENGLAKVLSGETTIEEILRVTSG
ncbi:Type II secretion system protein E [BD1-7 clade bacterium]|uniref:Type II secretion system protein E n=1 Tax=BD1-7 clade bacterium TaxID=2029982 RepID=A0A5S9R238_9GAMM|nr:Type II secretion system protein E [BD1-7 clade bacterium]